MTQEVETRKLREVSLQDECRQLWEGLFLLLRSLEPLEKKERVPIISEASRLLGLNEAPTAEQPPQQKRFDVWERAFIQFLADAERDFKTEHDTEMPVIPEPPGPWPTKEMEGVAAAQQADVFADDPYAGLYNDVYSGPIQRSKERSIRSKARSTLKLGHQICQILCMVVGMIVVLKVPGLVMKLLEVMDPRSRGHCIGIWVGR